MKHAERREVRPITDVEEHRRLLLQYDVQVPLAARRHKANPSSAGLREDARTAASHLPLGYVHALFGQQLFHTRSEDRVPKQCHVKLRSVAAGTTSLQIAVLGSENERSLTAPRCNARCRAAPRI